MPQSSPRPPRKNEDPVTGRILAAAIEAHRILGPGLLEAIYEEALCHELGLIGMPFERQKEVSVRYKGVSIKGQRIDLVVDSKVIVEIKAVKKLDACLLLRPFPI